jgi:tyrosine decarboxylase/aspartate 1-decarboxylase
MKKPKKMEDELSRKGWQVSKANNPCSLRFVIMPHVKKRHIGEFIPVFKRVAKKLKEI